MSEEFEFINVVEEMLKKEYGNEWLSKVAENLHLAKMVVQSAARAGATLILTVPDAAAGGGNNRLILKYKCGVIIYDINEKVVIVSMGEEGAHPVKRQKSV